MTKPPERAEFKDLELLLVDDDVDFRNAVQMLFERLGFKVTPAENGRVAQQIFGLQDFDLVFSDIRMPLINGIELTHFIKSQRAATPVVLATGFSEIKETEEAHRLGADGFLAKPFKKDELLETLRQVLRKSGETQAPAPAASLDMEFCRLNIDEFISGRRIKYNIFVRLSETNYVKIAHEGEDLTPDRIQAYRQKNIHFLYLRREDFERYVGLNLSLAPAVRASATLPQPKKLAFFKHVNEILLEQLHADGVTEERYSDATVTVTNTISLLSSEEQVFQLISGLGFKGHPLFTHSVAVSLYSVMIARECGWSSPSVLVKVGLAGLMHDIGFKEIDEAILRKPRSELTPEEALLYESHSLRGMEILSTVPSIPEDVARVAFQHHEDCLGLGYPRGLTRSKIDPLARLVAVADTFCTTAWDRAGNTLASGPEAAKRIHALYGDRLDTDFLSALLRLYRLLGPGEALKKAAH